MTLGVLAFVVGIFVMILAHEAGHYVAAKAFGIKVEEFFLGFGPRVWSFRKGETEYGVKALPLGGYVRIAGMNPFQEPAPEDLPRTYAAKPAWQRAIVLVAGSAMHFVLAFVALSLLFGAVGIPRAQVERVEPTLGGEPSPAAQAGVLPGDEVLRVDGRDVTYDEFVVYTRGHVGEEIELVVRRDGREVVLNVTPVLAEVDGVELGRLGIVLTQGSRLRSGPLEAIGRGARLTGTMVVQSFQALARVFGPEGLGRLFRIVIGQETRQADRDVIGVVGAARLAGQASSAGAWELLLLMFAGFNVFVGIFNMLPLPPLDGGHLAVLVIEKVTRRRIDPRRLLPITALVAGLLILVMVSVTTLDIFQPIPDPFR